MNIGLIILVTSLFVGAEDNNNDQPVEIKKLNSERVTTNEEVVKNKISINQSDEIPQNTSGIDKSVNKKNSPPTIQGESRVKINQDEYYSFTPLVNDPENDKLEFDITNKPQWAIFDSRTGTLFGQPTNNDIGISKNITITVMDQSGGTSSLVPFNLEVININDKPTISGIPRLFFTFGKTYNFTPNASDIDLDIGKDKLIFSIKNKPQWAKFNKNDSVNDIYQLFKDVDLDEIYAWIEVATQYSRYGESINYSRKAEDVVPILFKGNNPYSGEFNGNTYWKGYMQ